MAADSALWELAETLEPADSAAKSSDLLSSGWLIARSSGSLRSRRQQRPLRCPCGGGCLARWECGCSRGGDGGFRRRGQDRPGGCGRHRHGQEPDFLFLPSLPTPSASRRSLRPEINRCGTHRPQVLLITSNTPDGGNTRESLVGRLSARRKACLHACVLATDLHPRDAGGFWIGTASSGQEPLAGKPDGRLFICVGMTQRLGVRSPKPAECVFDSRHPCEAPPIGERA